MVTIFLWAVVGGAAGLIFGLTAGLPARMMVFIVLLGAGSAAVPLVEAEMRQRRGKSKTVATSSLPHALLSERRNEKVEGVLSPDEARRWLDDFLLKQQEKT